MARKGTHWLLVSDLIGSRKIRARQSFENQLTQVLQQVRSKYADAFSLPVKAWKGLDEIAAVLKKPWLAYRIMEDINQGIAPEKMRFVMVKDRMSLPSSDLSEADGPAFHKAMAEMTLLKENDMLFSLNSGNEEQDLACVNQLNLLMLLKAEWTEQQMNIYSHYGRLGSQEKTAEELGISQQAVSKALKSIRAARVLKMEEQVEKWMESAFKD